MSGGDPIANIKLLEGPAKNLAVIMKDGKISKNTLSTQRDAQEPSSIPKRKRGLNQRYRSASTAEFSNKICHERTFDSAKRNYPTHSDKQVSQNRKNSHLCREPTDWPYSWRGEGVGGNIKQPGDDEHPSPNYRQ
jgi:hypothetical protein